MRSSTSVWSAICGIHFGDTNAVASTAGSPTPASRSISSTFTAVGTSPGSFCRPSRGPTSTILTELFKGDQLRALEHLLARRIVNFLHHALGGRGDRVLLFHRFQDQQRFAFRHPGAGPGHLLDDLARHGRGERAPARVVVDVAELGLERKAPVIAFAEDMPVVPGAQRARLESVPVEAHEQASVGQPLARKTVSTASNADAQAAFEEKKPYCVLDAVLHKDKVVVRVLVQPPAIDPVPGRKRIAGGCGAAAGDALLFGELRVGRGGEQFGLDFPTGEELGLVALDQSEERR